MYGRVYLAHADAAHNRLELYRFYTDTIILQHVYELVSPKVRPVMVLGVGFNVTSWTVGPSFSLSCSDRFEALMLARYPVSVAAFCWVCLLS
jgi:hypothetical protein